MYVLRSLRDRRLYVGMTGDLEKRVIKHNAGGVPSTKYRRPLVLIYHEELVNRSEARTREKFLKSGPGHAFLKSVFERDVLQ